MKMPVYLLFLTASILNFAFSITGIKLNPEKTHRVFLLNQDDQKARKIIWIFPGFQTESDAYRQNPKWIIRYWNLERLSEKMHAVIILPDISGTVYPLYEKDSDRIHPDMEWLCSVQTEIASQQKAMMHPIFIGISSGVEGAVKFASLITNRAEIIAISGTYDYSKLSHESGEYRIHLKQFGNNPETWQRENPLEIMKKFDHIRIHLFCEEKSIYFMQAQLLTDISSERIKVISYSELGKGFSHEWKFWKSKELLRTIDNILSE